MRTTRSPLVLWAPRLVGLGLAAFLALFASDVFNEGRGILGAIVALSMHLIPSLLILALVLIGWRHEAIASAGFIALAVFYTTQMRERLASIVLIDVPLLLVAALFLFSWWSKRRGAEELMHR